MPKDKPSTSGKSEAKKKTGQRSAIGDVVAREYTIHLHKRVCRKNWFYEVQIMAPVTAQYWGIGRKTDLWD
jgi:hypothetical protein